MNKINLQSSDTFKIKIKLSNFGTIKNAEYEINDLTIICGKNNTGKTYATYAFYGFVDFFRHGFEIDVDRKDVENLFKNNITSIKIDDYVKQREDILKKASQQYSRSNILSEVFGSEETAFKESSFELTIDNLSPVRDFKWNISLQDNDNFCHVEMKDGILDIKRQNFKEDQEIKSPYIIERIIGDCIKECLFDKYFSRAFIACAERTGAAIFQRELDFTRNRLIEMIGDQEMKKITPMLFFKNFSSKYPIPIRRNVDTVREIPEKEKSFIIEKDDECCKEILKLFSSILGGSYKVINGEMRFIPDYNKSIKLNMILSSSSVRALLHIGVYLLFQAQKGDILIIDEPEQNLHPENQRKFARLIAVLVNAGVRVIITTHSDYIIRELSALIIMESNKERYANVIEKFKYSSCHLLSHEKVSAYLAGESLMKLPDNQRKTKIKTLIPIKVSPEYGIDADNFDSTIREMNNLFACLSSL